VPLSDAAMAVLEAMQKVRTGDFVFPGPRNGHTLHERAMLDLLNRLSADTKVTVHGFRSAFSDWVTETTSFTREERELALAHAVGTATELAYRRGTMFEKRRALAEAWARYLGSESEVVTLPQRVVG
jgi:integrase